LKNLHFNFFFFFFFRFFYVLFLYNFMTSIFVIGGKFTFFGSLGGDIDIISNLRGTLTIEW
jgi:hypothetical protein